VPPKHRPKHSAPRKFVRPGARPPEKHSEPDEFSSLSPRRSPAAPADSGERLRDYAEPDPTNPGRGLFAPEVDPKAPEYAGIGDPANRRGPSGISRQDKPTGEDFWNDPLPPRRRTAGEGRQRDLAGTSVMEASPAQSFPEAEPPRPRKPRPHRADEAPKVTRITSTDKLPPERLEAPKTSSQPDDGQPETVRPYAKARVEREYRDAPQEPPPVQVMSPRKARKAAAAEAGNQSQTLGQWFKEITILGVVAVGTAVLLTTYLVQAFFIPSASMENTLTKDDRVLVNKLVYKFGDPKPGDIIVFVSPEGVKAPPPANTPYARFMDRVAIAIGLKSSEQDLIKRVIATGGQTIEAKVGLVFVDGRQLVEPYRKSTEPISDIPAQKVPEGDVFVLGDNRTDSRDSRIFGPVPVSSIIGKSFARIWPLERLTWF
jgi:signal peptidase I